MDEEFHTGSKFTSVGSNFENKIEYFVTVFNRFIEIIDSSGRCVTDDAYVSSIAMLLCS